ncbi:GNAT family N-acetyltransferase [Nocardioides dubius]|uniref:N-acetyltransferase domain-containing protein n=1 Tax=Nocardioides dubius TaxID=317019 RepID=A0ABN1TPU7_9ACTN
MSSDTSVRVAWADDAAAIARAQLAAWHEAYRDLLPPAVLADLAPDAVAAGWQQALSKPGDARNRVLVALLGNQVQGFVTTSPAADPDCDPIVVGEVGELTLLPDQRRLGHGSRLLQAAADTLSADRFTRAVTWVNAADDGTRAFLTSAGWAADGAHRELELDAEGVDGRPVRLKQVRLHTALR